MIDSSAARSLGEFIRRLQTTYREIDGTGTPLLTLTLAGAALDELQVRAHTESLPTQIAVIGPTQAGKSTVVNLLLGEEWAKASPLAAFTRDLTGFLASPDAGDTERVGALFGDQAPRMENIAPLKNQNEGSGWVIWDTPDFDSHRSHDYRTLIAKVGAVADAFVLVVSKEKYADLSVWDTLDAIRPLGRRLIVCLNKVSSEREVLVSEVRARLRESGWGESSVPVVSLPYDQAEDVHSVLSQVQGTEQLRRLVFDAGNRCTEKERVDGLCAVIADNWERWLRPVWREIDAARLWRGEVDRRLGEALATYEAQYLDQTNHNDAFRKAVLQLLELLEIPMLAVPLTRARNLLTWPLRKLTSVFGTGGEGSRSSTESEVLEGVMDHAVLALHAAIVREGGSPGQAGAWWRSLGHCFDRESNNMKTEFSSEIKRYQEVFEPEIKEAARSLHERLQQNPVMLNTLRASRATADAAGVVIAVNTGTVGITDALLTPAMLSLTSMMTEGAVGRYMENVRSRLLDRQRTLVRALFSGQPRQALLAAGTGSPDPGLFRISEEDLEGVARLRTEFCR